jgi:hypothetical protein
MAVFIDVQGVRQARVRMEVRAMERGRKWEKKGRTLSSFGIRKVDHDPSRETSKHYEKEGTFVSAKVRPKRGCQADPPASSRSCGLGKKNQRRQLAFGLREETGLKPSTCS